MNNKKNIRLLIILLVLIVVTVALMFTGGSNSRPDIDQYKFSIADTSRIDKVVLKNAGETTRLEKTGNRWMVNNNYVMNDRLNKLLLAIMNRVKIKRPVAKQQLSSINDALDNEGTLVEIYENDEVILSFIVGGNDTKTVSYFKVKDSGDPYVVYIPGYTSDLTGFFNLKENDWRDNKIFSTSWRSLIGLKIEYDKATQNSFEIIFQDNFFVIPGINQVDTTVMMDYVSLFENFGVDRFVTAGTSAEYDSLARTDPFAKISLEEIDSSKNQQLILYPKLPDDNKFLGKLSKEDQLVIIGEKRAELLLKKKEDYIAN
ncbi:hypothetical protein QQ008_15975 [Fulvivirgaceae bacterium BMA10]|uniref:DUF4340 domain-containing protein n=1 Tax=Splendidivirga corallicola TaxID=3051826 RepID=A0ABT8KRR1_9BACT|nr:hypothetical protein [Fulvivirgaceae bacterium BMA10]